MTPLSLTIAGVPISTDLPFTWSFRTGTQQGGGTVTVPMSVAGELYRNAGAGKTIVVRYWDSHNQNERTVTIRNVLLSSVFSVEADERGALLATFTLRDPRWEWAQRRLVGHFGLTRRTNDLQITEAGDELEVPGQQAEARGGFAAAGEPELNDDGQIVGFAQADVIGQSNPVPRTIYRPLTLDWNDENFENHTEEGKPWTALRGVQAILRGYWIKRADGTFEKTEGLLKPGMWGGLRGFDGRQPDNGYPLARQSHLGTPYPQVLQQWMLWARVSCTFWVDGRLYLHPIDLTARPTLPAAPPLIQGQRLVTRDYRTERPKRVRVGYRCERERMFGYSRTADGTTPVAPEKDVPPELLVNVIRIPQPQTLDLGDGEREYPVGTYLPIEPVLQAWGISVEWLERHWFLQWQTYYAYLRDETPPGSTETQQRTAAIGQAFRRLYQVSPYYVQQIVDLSNESVVIIDPVTGTRQPTPAWVDYVLTRNARYSPLDLGDAELLWNAVRYARDEETESELPLPDEDAEGGKPGPYRFEVVDPVLGILNLVPVNDMLGIIDQQHVGAVEPIEDGEELLAIPAGNGAHLAGARLSSDFGVAAVATILSLDPNSRDQLYWVEVSAAAAGARPGEADVQEIVVSDETARYAYDGTLVNEQLLAARSLAEARALYEAYNPVLIGGLSWGGWHEVYPFGTAAATTWTLQARALTTTLEMPQPPVPRSAEQHLSQQYRDYVLRLPKAQ